MANHGTLPMDELYFELRPQSCNLGAVEQPALIAGLPQNLAGNSEGNFQLLRIGDAVSPRNTRAAVYDALQLAEAI